MTRGESGGRGAEARASAFLAFIFALSALAPFIGGIQVPTGPASSRSIVLSERSSATVEAASLLSGAGVQSTSPVGTYFDYVLSIVLENKGICQILTTCGGSAPYLTSLANESGLAMNYLQCGAPSLLNYLCLTAASTFGCTTNAPPAVNPCTTATWNATNLVDRLEAANLTWKAYLESMPSNCHGDNTGLYAVKHNPFVYYGDIATNASRCARVVPSGASNQVLLADIESTATASNYMWFTPNLCHDMHDCNVTEGDAFLAGLVPQILNSSVFRTQRAALLITFDEDGGRGSPNLYTVWSGPVAKRGYGSSLPYDHFSALRTIEANWNLEPLNGNDSAATPMNEFFFGPPTARFATSPAWPQGNTTVTFNASSSSSNVPDSNLEYRWDWTHDGTWDTNWSATPTAEYAYGSSGVHTAALQVRDSVGSVNETTRPVAADDAPPVTDAFLSGTLGSGGWYTGNVTVTLVPTDDLSGVAGTTYDLDGSGPQSYANPIVVSGDGNHTVRYHSEDAATNVEPDRTTTFREDSTAPVTAVTFAGTVEGNVFVSAIQVTLSAADGGSGVAGTTVQVDGAETNYTGPFFVSNEGTHSVQYASLDVAGNAEPANAFAVTNGTISGVAGLASQALLNGTLGASGWYTSPVTVTLQLVNGTSPSNSIWYSLDGGAWTLYSQPFLVSGDDVHRLDFNATNGAGLNEVVHQAVIAIDTTPPATTSAVTGTPGDNGWYVSDVTVVLTATDETSGVANISYRIDGGPWSLYTEAFSLTEGEHTVDWYATDLAGLVDPIQSLSVAIDTTPPATTAELSGTPGENGWYVSGVTVFLNASDAMSGVAGISYQVDGSGWTIYSGPFVVSDGVHRIEYFATDLAGLPEAAESRSVSVDTTPPATSATVSGTAGANGWFVSNVTVFLNGTDATSGLADTGYRVDGGEWLIYTGPFALGDGQHTVEFFSTDSAGLSEATQSQSIWIDTSSPATTATPSGTAGANGWYTSNVVVDLAATDSLSGIVQVYDRVDGGSWALYTGPFTVTEGAHLVEFYAVNGAGLPETPHGLTVRVDTAPPTSAIAFTGTAGANGWYISDVTVSIVPTDATSGVAELSYRIDNGSWLPYSGPFLLGEGRHVVEFYARDLAGNVESTQTRSIASDSTPPSTSTTLSGSLGDNGWYVSGVSLSLTGTDATSGVATIAYRIDGGTWTTYSGPFTLGEGRHIIEYASTDLAGNVEVGGSVSASIDTTRPRSSVVLSGSPGDNGWYRSNVSVSLDATDAISGVARIAYRIDNGSWFVYSDPFLLTNGEHYLEYFATDVAGLGETTHATTIRINTIAPVTTAVFAGTPGDNGWYVSEVSVTLNAADGRSGVDAILYRLDGGSWVVYSDPFRLAEGHHLLEYYAVDRAGNAEPVQSKDFAIDTTAPLTEDWAYGTLGADVWYVSNVSIVLEAADGTSGVAGLTYQVDGSPWRPYTVPLDLGPGRHVVRFYATDRAGLASPIRTRIVSVDTAAPTTTDAIGGTAGENGWYISGVTVTLMASDPLSGIASTEYRLDGGAWLPYTEPFSITQGGAHVVEFASADVAGNQESPHRFSVNVETSPPYFLSLSPASNSTTSPVRIAWSADDNESGIADYAVRVDDGRFMSVGTATSITLHLTEGPHVIQVKATDRAGQSTVRSLSIQIPSSDRTTFSWESVPLGLALGAAIAAAFVIWRIRRRRKSKTG